MTDIHNIEHLKSTRKKLRNNLTLAEARLWKYLQRSQLENRKFRRQHSICNYILDFYCPAEKLAVELDGGQHYTEEGQEYDEKRTDLLNKLDIRVIRFTNTIIFENIEWVLTQIKEKYRPPLSPP